MNIWFMFDNHTFANVGPASLPRAEIEAKLNELFAQDGSGSAFARSTVKGQEILHLHGRLMANGRWGVGREDVQAFLDQIDEAINWLARG